MARGKYEYWLTEEGLLQLEAWARDGLTDEQIAHNMGIATKTLFNWKNTYLPILHALKRGKEIVDIQVENALFKKAVGYNVTVKKTFKVKHIEYDETTGKKLSEKEVLETGYDEIHVPADTTAQIYWLKNRKSNKWKDKPIPEPDNSGKTNEGILALAELLNRPRPNRDIRDFENDE